MLNVLLPRSLKTKRRRETVAKPKQTGVNKSLTSSQRHLSDLWEEHVQHEFSTRHTEKTLATMVEDAYVNHVPVLTGGIGKDELRGFYSTRFIPQMPPDTEMIPVSRTIGENQLVDEMVFKFTHTIPMDWMLPGVAPPENALRFRWWQLCGSKKASWLTNIFTGIRHPCSFR
jgi:carboxymethylenebutenolidase